MAHCKVEDSADFVIVTHGSQHNGETLIKRQILISSDGYHYSFRNDRPRRDKRIYRCRTQGCPSRMDLYNSGNKIDSSNAQTHDRTYDNVNQVQFRHSE